MTISELTTEQLQESLLNGYRYLDRAPQVRQEIAVMEQEMQRRKETEKKVDSAETVKEKERERGETVI